jgi:hypothetical protein
MKITKDILKNTIEDLKTREENKIKIYDSILQMSETTISEEVFVNFVRQTIYDLGIEESQIYAQLFEALDLLQTTDKKESDDVEIEEIPKTKAEIQKEKTQEEVEEDAQEYKRRLVAESEDYEAGSEKTSEERNASIMERLKQLKKR